MTITVAIAGDTMLGRGVGAVLRRDPAAPLLDGPLREVLAGVDLVLLNLECCVSDRGEPWPDPRKRFFFRAPPVAADRLAELGVDCVTLANNHVLDYGEQALRDTFTHLADAGVAWVGAGPDAPRACAPLVLERSGLRIRIVAFADHPAAYAATMTAPGIAFVDLRAAARLPDWLRRNVAPDDRADATIVSPHWGPNMTAGPVRSVRTAAAALHDAGATLIAGHSAHVFHGVAPGVLYDVGDFLDDYATHRRLRNDLGLLFVVELGPEVRRIEAIPLRLAFAHTAVARGADARWIRRTFAERCARFGTAVEVVGERLVVR